MKKALLIILQLAFVSIHILAQVDTTKVRVAMIVHADREFPLYNDNTDVINIASHYDVVELNSEGVENHTFYKITIKWKYTDTLYRSCDFYMAYNKLKKRFYRLSGFKQSEFMYFLNIELMNDAVRFPRGINKEKQRLKYIKNNVKIEGIDILGNYERFSKSKNGCYDINSCYDKYHITIYGPAK